MKKTLTISIAGLASTNLEGWIRWEQLVGEIARQMKLSVTHSATRRKGDRYVKFTTYSPLNESSNPRQIATYSLASVPAKFVTIIQDAELIAERALDGLDFTIATAGRTRPEEFVRENLKLLEGCLDRVDGKTAFLLPPSELAANFAHGMNDIRDCAKAKVLLYKPGGFLSP